MAWKSGSAAALRNRNEKERQEKTVMATAAGGAEPLSQRKSADSRNPLALGRTENSDLIEQGSSERVQQGHAAEGNSAETAAISDNLAVQTFAEAAAALEAGAHVQQ